MEQQLFTAPSVFNFANYPLKNKDYSGSYNCDLKRPNYITFTPKICNPCVSNGFELVKKIHMDKSIPSATCHIKKPAIKSKDFVLQPLIIKELVNSSLKYYNSVFLPMTIESQKVFILVIERVKELLLNHQQTITLTLGGIGSGIEFVGTRGRGIKLRAVKNSSKFKHLYPIIPTYLFIMIKSENINEFYKIPNAKILNINIDSYLVKDQ